MVIHIFRILFYFFNKFLIYLLFKIILIKCICLSCIILMLYTTMLCKGLEIPKTHCINVKHNISRLVYKGEWLWSIMANVSRLADQDIELKEDIRQKKKKKELRKLPDISGFWIFFNKWLRKIQLPITIFLFKNKLSKKKLSGLLFFFFFLKKSNLSNKIFFFIGNLNKT